MSAFFLSINRDRSAMHEQLAERMFAGLDRFAVDGKQLVVNDYYAIGYQSFWTVPEEQSEQQPLYHVESNSWLVFIGRIDNRSELIAEIRATGSAVISQSVSDAQLLLEYLLAFDGLGLEKIVGPFVFVHFHPSSGRVLSARDVMGGRYLVYHVSDQHILISSYEMALVAHPSIEYKFDPEKRIRMLCNIMENQPNSPIESLSTLLPGEQLSINDGAEERSRFYVCDPKRRIRLASSQEYALEFRRLFDQAVKRRLRSVSPVGVMLSGGMDSVPIAISASQQLDQHGQQLSAFSWVYDRFPEADERQYSGEVCTRFNINHHLIKSDDIWPKFDDSLYLNPVMPFNTPYIGFTQSLLGQAQQQGVRTLLTGYGGDMLYTGANQVVLDHLKAGQFKAAFKESQYLLGKAKSILRFARFFIVAPLELPRLKRVWRRLRGINLEQLDFLTVEAQKQLKIKCSWLTEQMQASLRPQQYRNVMDAFEGEDANNAKHLDSVYQVERRYPFRDRDLIEFMLAIPTDQLYSLGVARPIIKNAFTAEFSQTLLNRSDKTNFYTVIKAGLDKDTEMQRWLNAPEKVWNRYVKECNFDDENTNFEQIDAIKWSCAYHEYWRSACYTADGNA